LGDQLVTKGNGEYIIYEDDSLLSYSKGQLNNGLKTGKWIGYFKNGRVLYEEEYENNNLTKGLSYDSNGNKYRYEKVNDFNLTSFYKFIASNLKYPANARRYGIEGKIILQIVFDPKGQSINSKIVKGIGGGCDEEAMRVVDKYNGKWKGAKRRGQPITKPQSMYLPITFKLG